MSVEHEYTCDASGCMETRREPFIRLPAGWTKFQSDGLDPAFCLYACSKKCFALVMASASQIAETYVDTEFKFDLCIVYSKSGDR